MKRKFDELRENLEEFVEQNLYPMLMIGCLPQELAYVIKFLQGLEQTHPESYFIVFANRFNSPSGYLDGVVESLSLQVAAAHQTRTERAEPPFPPVPPNLSDHQRLPEERLRGVLEYLRTLLPNEKDHSVVVGFLPLECQDSLAYARLMSTIMPVTEIEPWMTALRIVIYDDRSEHLLQKAMQARQIDKILAYEIDFSTPALTNALTVDASNPEIPVPERMGYLMQLAALDFAYKRHVDALQKYGVLYKYYESNEVPSMQALCLLGAGDTLRAAGKLELAKEYLQRGIALAMEHKQLAPMLNLLISLVETSFDLGHHADAESYADSGTKVAAGALNPFSYADLYERKGDAQIAQGKTAEGMATYKRCEELCKMYEYFHRWKSVLNHRIRLSKQTNMRNEQREAEHELARVLELERRGGTAAVEAAAQARPEQTP